MSFEAMATPVLIPGRFVGGRIEADWSPAEIAKTVMAGSVVILKGVFAAESERLLAFRQAIHAWGADTEPAPEPLPTENTHCMQSGVSKLQRTPHVYHSFNLNRISQLPAPLAAEARRYFQALTDFQNSITGNRAKLEVFDQGPILHPQVIQYPVGGGLFGRHHHALVPQQIGLIASMSRRGVDFDRGGAGFDTPAGPVEIELHHDLGDMALFRFDLPHWVTSSSLREKFRWEADNGRWSLVLPYY